MARSVQLHIFETRFKVFCTKPIHPMLLWNNYSPKLPAPAASPPSVPFNIRFKSQCTVREAWPPPPTVVSPADTSAHPPRCQAVWHQTFLVTSWLCTDPLILCWPERPWLLPRIFLKHSPTLKRLKEAFWAVCYLTATQSRSATPPKSTDWVSRELLGDFSGTTQHSATNSTWGLSPVAHFKSFSF